MLRSGLQPVILPACFKQKSLCDQCWCNVSMYFYIAPLGAALCCLRPLCELHKVMAPLSHQQQHIHTNLLILEHHVYFICAILMFCVFSILFSITNSCLHCTKYRFWNIFYSYKMFGFKKKYFVRVLISGLNLRYSNYLNFYFVIFFFLSCFFLGLLC